MNTSPISIVITLFFWYILIGIYNLAYLGLTKKIGNLDWRKFILETLGLVFVYFVINAASVQIAGSQSVALFSILNAVLIFVLVLPYSKFIMKFETLDAAIYSLIFTLIFNLYWYSLFGIL